LDKRWAKKLRAGRGSREYNDAIGYFTEQEMMARGGFEWHAIAPPKDLKDAHDRKRFIAEALEDAHQIFRGELETPRAFKYKTESGEERSVAVLKPKEIAAIKKGASLDPSETDWQKARVSVDHLI